VATFRYAKTHEYVKEDAGTYFLGISEHAQKELGDITFIELPSVGAEFAAGEVCCTVESVKAVAEVYAPVALKVSVINEKLEDQPELVNEDSQGQGWMLQIELKDPAELSNMLDQEGYTATLS